MLDMNFIRNNPEAVKENIRKKFQDEKLPLVDKAIELDKQYRTYKAMDDNLRNQKNVVSKEIGKLIGQGKKEEAEDFIRIVISMGSNPPKVDFDQYICSKI